MYLPGLHLPPPACFPAPTNAPVRPPNLSFALALCAPLAPLSTASRSTWSRPARARETRRVQARKGWSEAAHLRAKSTAHTPTQAPRAATRLGALGHGVLGLRGGEEGGAVARGRAEGGVSGRARGMTRRGRREGARRLYSPARPGAAGARPSAPRGSSASASWRSAPGARPRWPAWREGEGWRKGGREGSGGAGQRVGSAAASASAREREEALRGLASAPRRAPRRAPRCVRLLSSTHQAVERVVDERVHDRPA